MYRRSSQLYPGLCAELLLLAACGAEPTEPIKPASNTPTAGQPPTTAAGASGAGNTALAGAASVVTPSAPPTAQPANTAGGPTGGMLAAAGSAAMAAAGSGGHAGTAAGSGGAPQAMPPSAAATVATLYWLDINANRVMRSQNFARGETIVMRTGTAPDGVSVDVAGGKLYWTNMGSPLGTGGGSLQRANLDGTQVETIVAPGISQTPKQMQLDLVNQHLYWCDREGAKVWRAGMDGSQPEVIASEHGFRELVGVALDVPAGKFYFSDRIDKKLLRANIQMPAGQTGATRSDIEEQVVLTGNAMPIDLEIDHSHHYLYWTDRQRGTVERAGLEIPTGATAANRTDIETLVTGLTETIGIAVDVANDKMYFAELGGRISSAALDGSNVERGIVSSGSATGVAIAHIPAP